MFSSSLVLADMDYIAPSQACIKPAMSRATQPTSSVVYRHGDADAPAPEILKISLQDCLACSGCVTSAETMLVTSQSKEELVSIGQASPPRWIIVSISDQSSASLAAMWRCSMRDAAHVVARFVRATLGAKLVVTLDWAQDVAVQLTMAEYAHRVANEPHRLPYIVSSCPGWVCYCEKQYPELIPHLSTVMSPQGIAGSLLKQCAVQSRATTPEAVYHVSIQPCFDRKLEGARDGNAESGERFTDCVLSTHELLEWMNEHAAPDTPMNVWGGAGEGIDAVHIPSSVIARPSHQSAASGVSIDEEAAASHAEEWMTMGGSGGYHQRVLLEVGRSMGTLLTSSDVQYEIKRNANLRLLRTPYDDRLSLVHPAPNGATHHLFCIAYGFQHIQNLVRGMRKRVSSTPRYTFVELMACPNGCLNGGGQVRTSAPHEETLGHVRAAFVSHQHGSGGDDNGTVASPSDESECASPTMKVARLESSVATTVLGCLGSLMGDIINGSSFIHGLGDVAVQCTTTVFHDRKKEMEEILNANPLHTLKW